MHLRFSVILYGLCEEVRIRSICPYYSCPLAGGGALAGKKRNFSILSPTFLEKKEEEEEEEEEEARITTADFSVLKREVGPLYIFILLFHEMKRN